MAFRTPIRNQYRSGLMRSGSHIIHELLMPSFEVAPSRKRPDKGLLIRQPLLARIEVSETSGPAPVEERLWHIGMVAYRGLYWGALICGSHHMVVPQRSFMWGLVA